MLSLQIEDRPLARIVFLTGELNTHTCATLSRVLDERFQLPVSHIILDLSEVNELTSATQQVIFDSCRKSIASRAGKRIAFCGLREEIAQLLKMTGLSKFIPTYPSVDIALQSIESASH